MPLSLKTRDPAQYDTIRRAVERARQDGTTKDLGTTALTTADVLGALDESVAAARHEGALAGGNPLDRITNPETHMALEASLEATETLFARISLETPDLATLRDQHGNLANLPRLASVYEQMEREGKEPVFILAPVMTKDEAIALYDSMTPERDGLGNITRNPTGMPANNPLRQHGDGNGLFIGSDISIPAVWDHLHDVTTNPLTNPDSTTSRIYTDGNGRRWSLRVIQGTRFPDNRNISYADQPYGHPSISEYLTMQAVRILEGEPPYLIRNWLQGAYLNGSLATYSYWSTADGQVYVDWGGTVSLRMGCRSSAG